MPFANDIGDVGTVDVKFDEGWSFKTHEWQLMGVFSANSGVYIPAPFYPRMTNGDSTTKDFHPETFEIDMNGKKMAWQGVALLPFIEMPRLLAEVEKRYPHLSEEDTARNEPGREILILSEANQELYDDIISNFYSKKQGAPVYKLNPRLSQGLAGKVEKLPDYLPHGPLEYPLERKSMPDLDDDRSLT